MERGQLRNSLLLLLAAVIWGTTFVAQRVGLDHVESFTFNASRFFIGFAVLLPVAVLLHRQSGKGLTDPGADGARTRDRGQIRQMLTPDLLRGGLCCGFCLFCATNCQQISLNYTTVGKAGFITACYIVIVPILGLFLHRPCSPFLWIAVGLAVMGMYLLCVKEGFSVGRGDLLALVGAFLFSFHILSVDHFSPLVQGTALSCLQFLVAGLFSLAASLLVEAPSWRGISQAAFPILYAGILSCGVAYTLQIVGQKNLNPTLASLIMSLESCISAIAGWLVLGQALSRRELAGCCIMFAAIVLAQLPPGQKQAG